MPFVFSNLHMNNLSNDIVSTIKQFFADDVLLSFITLINAKINLMSPCHFMNSDLNKQAQALEVTFSRKTKSYHSQTCFNNIL